MTRRCTAHWVMLACIVAFGCNDHNQYVVELTPRGQEVERRITFWRVDPREQAERVDARGHAAEGSIPPDERNIVAFPAAELARIAAPYPRCLTPGDARKHTFAGSFGEKLPADVGGSGHFVRFDSSLGSTSIYCERFRGEDDLVRSRKERYRLIDEAVTLAIGWLEQELGKERGFDKLRAFLDGQLRRDVRVISDYAWTAAQSIDSIDRGRSAGPEFIARASQYLVERGYFAARDLPGLVRLWNDEEKVLGWLREFVAGKMGLDRDKPPKSLDFLASSASAASSLDRFFVKTPQYKKLVEQWERDQKTKPDLARPKPKAVYEQWWDRVCWHVGLLHIADKVEVRLHCPSRPHETNGQWDEKSQRVVWQSDIREGFWLPTLCFAAWSEPNVAAQREHFGGVVLAGESLRDYVVWHAGLTRQEAGQWDAFVESLRPDIHLANRLKSFQFNATPQTDAAKRLADRVRSLILRGLEQRQQQR